MYRRTMRRSTVRLSAVLLLIWVVIVVACLLAGLRAVALVVFLAPLVLWLVALLGFRLYWQRHPEHRRVGDWFKEEHHIGHW
jgi:uncharacterized membrane protein